jgi:uncharacterized membrane protein
MPADASLLTDIPLFAELDDDEKKLLADVVDVVNVKKGDTLFRAGDPGHAMYVVVKGEIELFIKDHAGQRITLTDAKVGDVFGELAMLDEGPRTASALATDDAELLELDRDDILLLVKKKPEAALHMLGAMGAMTRKADMLLRTRVARNPNEEIEDKATFGERIADKVASFGGSWAFIFAFGAFMVVWMGVNVALAAGAWDEYPFILLNLMLSSLAALQAPVIMMSQNRQAAKDRIQADIEYDVNVKAELEVAHLHEKIDEMREDVLARLQRLERALGGKSSSEQRA